METYVLGYHVENGDGVKSRGTGARDTLTREVADLCNGSALHLLMAPQDENALLMQRMETG